MTLPNPQRQKSAREKLTGLFVYPETVYAIHYACQSFYTGGQLASTRISCVSVRQLASGQTTSFSIAKAAELQKVSPSEIPLHWNLLERAMLDEFRVFLDRNPAARFIHWNMRDETFGFPAIALRGEVLGVTPLTVPQHYQFDIARILLDLLGDTYVVGKHKFEALSRLNGLSMSDFLPGDQEAEAFRRGEFRKIQMSVQTKVRLIADLAQMANDQTLKSQASLLARHGGPLRIVVQSIVRHPARAAIGGGITSSVPIYHFLKWFWGE